MRSVSNKRVLKPFAVRAEARSFSLHPPASEGLRAGASGGLKGVGMMMSQPIANALLHNNNTGSHRWLPVCSATRRRGLEDSGRGTSGEQRR